MRFLPASSSLLPTVAVLLSAANIVAAGAVYHLVHDSVVLVQRQTCAGTPCGWNGFLCCASGQTCITNALNQAECVAGPTANADGGHWQYITSTYVETDLVTRTTVMSTYVGGAVATNAAQCSPCGTGCCYSGTYCLKNWGAGECAQAGGTTGVPAAPMPTTQATIVPTTTQPIMTATPAGQTGADTTTGGGGGGLSGGAIAGIVIGVLAGIILLALLCLFCCAKTLFDSILAIFGLGKRRKRVEETYVSEHHSHHGGGGRQSWYGQGPARPPKEEKKSKLGGLGALTAGLGGLALVLGLKRRHDRKQEEKSDYSSRSSDYYSDYTSSSSASSDRHTRQTRKSSRR